MVSSIRPCGVATLDTDPARDSSGTVRSMCSGVKIRVRTNSSHGMPLAVATTWPAAAYMTFW